MTCFFFLLAYALAQKAPILPLRWHFTPPTWTNDPSLLYNPLTRVFHDYYQAPISATPYAPWSPQGGGEVWRHMTTTDFVSFQDWGPINLTKGEGTGSLVVLNDTYFVRTFSGRGGTSIGGTGDADAAAWVDLPPFPRMPGPPTGNPFIGDPFLFYDVEGSEWVLLVSSCLGGTNFSSCVTPRVRKYTAIDLLTDTFSAVNESYFVGPPSTGPRSECPRAWRFPNAHLLIWSSPAQTRSIWFLGSATRSEFSSSASGFLDAGTFYAATLSPLPSAPQSFSGETSLLVGWVFDMRPIDPAIKWQNTMSSPRYISAAPDGLRLQQKPAPFLLERRIALLWEGNLTSDASGSGGTFFLPTQATGSSIWVDAQLLAWSPSCKGSNSTSGTASVSGFQWGLLLLSSPDAQEHTSLYILNGTKFVADNTKSSLDPAMRSGIFSASTSPASPGLNALTALVDTSLVEGFAHSDIQGEAVITVRSYPTRPDSQRVAVQISPPQGLGFCIDVKLYSMP